jgi:hypothetical protein
MEAIRNADQALKLIFVKYMHYSQSLFSPTLIRESQVIQTTVDGSSCDIAINYKESFSLNEQQRDLLKHDLPAIMDFITKLVKHSLSEQQYRQIGRGSKYYKADEQKPIDNFGLYVWPGYTCQVKCLNDGIFLNIDTNTKFLQQ